MKAIRIHGIGDIRVDDVSMPGSPGPGEVLIRVKSVGICGSDVHYYRDFRIGDTVVEPPMTLGHEFAGEIVECGPGVTNVKPGDRVAVEPGVPCEQCEPCRLERPNVCPNVKFAGAPPLDGAGCEYWIHPAKWVFPMPDSLSDGEGAMIEPFAVALHAVKRCGFEPGQSAAVMGGGAIGLCTLVALKALGAGPVFVSEPIAARRAVAEACGADGVIDPEREDVQARTRQWTDGLGVDAAFEAAGQPDAMNDAIRAAKRCGKACFIGICAVDAVPLALHEARRRELVIYNSRRAAHVNELALELMGSGKADLKPLITHEFSIQDAPRAFQMAGARTDGIVKPMIHI